MISLAYKISHCLSANHYPELRCVICTGVTLFAPVLHLNCTALSQSESSNFFMCIINAIIIIIIKGKGFRHRVFAIDDLYVNKILIYV